MNHLFSRIRYVRGCVSGYVRAYTYLFLLLPRLRTPWHCFSKISRAISSYAQRRKFVRGIREYADRSAADYYAIRRIGEKGKRERYVNRKRDKENSV